MQREKLNVLKDGQMGLNLYLIWFPIKDHFS